MSSFTTMAQAASTDLESCTPTNGRTNFALLTPGAAAGHSLMTLPAWSTVGKIYIVFICIYTAFILGSIAFVLAYHKAYNYDSKALDIRGRLITISALLSIHVYLAALFIVYPLNGYFLCGTEFWIMNIIFPGSIAIYQASNVRLKTYANGQKKMLDTECYSEKKVSLEKIVQTPREWWNAADWVKRVYAISVVAFLVQVSQASMASSPCLA